MLARQLKAPARAVSPFIPRFKASRSSREDRLPLALFFAPPAPSAAIRTHRADPSTCAMQLCLSTRLQAGLRCLATAVPSAPVQPVTKISTLPTGLVVASVRPPLLQQLGFPSVPFTY